MIVNAAESETRTAPEHPLERVVLVVEQAMLVNALLIEFDRVPSLDVVGSATDVRSGLALVRQTRPRLVLLDSDFPGGEAFDIACCLQDELQCGQCVFLAGSISDICIDQALRLNAAGFLSKCDPISTTVENVRKIASGMTCFSKEVYDRLDYLPMRGQYKLRFDTPLAALTNKQLEILRYLARGDSVKDVAAKLSLSPKSVDNHKYRIMNKVGVHNRVHLARFAIREGLIQP